MKKIFLLLLAAAYAVAVAAQLTIGAGAQWAVNGNLQLTLQNSSFINNGSFLSGTGKVSFTGEATAAIGGDQPVLFSELEMNKANQQSVLLQKNIFISRRLLFVAGFLDLNGFNINLGFTGLIEGEQEHASVTGGNGGVVLFSTNLDFPDNANPGNLGLLITAGQHIGNVIIRRGHQPQATSTGNSISRYYDILPADNVDINATLRFSYLNAELNGLDENGIIFAASANNHDWRTLGFSSRDTVNNFVEKSGINSFERFTLSALVGALPVRFVTVNTRCEGDKVLVTWKTAQEQNSHHFNIEKSTDGLHWSITGSLTAAGNSPDERMYSFVDTHAGANDFYRIAEVDADGRIQYSTIARSSCTINELFSVWPNPVSDKLYLRIAGANQTGASIKLFDSKGSLVKARQVALLPGSNQLELDMNSLAPGIYQVLAAWNNGQSTGAVRIVKR